MCGHASQNRLALEHTKPSSRTFAIIGSLQSWQPSRRCEKQGLVGPRCTQRKAVITRNRAAWADIFGVGFLLVASYLARLEARSAAWQ